MQKRKKMIKNILLGSVGAVVMICLAVSLTVWFRPLYYFDIDYLDIPQSSGVSAALCRLNYDALIDYNVPGGSDTLLFPTMPMSENGSVHFEEVKDIFIVMQWIALIGLAAFAVFWICEAVRAGRKQENGEAAKADQAEKQSIQRFRWMQYAVYITAAIGGIVLLAVLIDWEGAFAMMHKIFFDNDYWLFDPRTDPIIKILPDTFFMHCGLLIIGLTILFCAGLQLLYHRKTRNTHGKSHL